MPAPEFAPLSGTRSVVEEQLHDPPRLLLDMSSLARWTGPPVGMIRVQEALRRHLPDGAMAVFFDDSTCTLRSLQAPWDALILEENGCIDFGDRPRQSGWRAVASFRYAIFLILERHRITPARPVVAAVAAALQRVLLRLRRHNLVTHDAAGNRLARVPSGLALGAVVMPGPDDVLLMMGNGWYHAPAGKLAALKRRFGFQLAVVCYDIIALQRPGWFPEADAKICKTYWDAMFPLADRVIVNSNAVSADVTAYCAANGLTSPPIRCIPLAAASPAPEPPEITPLPPGLAPERYALFVSTIEPRKGHAMLLRAWRRVLATYATQGFRLVFIGRFGWDVQDVMTALQEMTAGGQVLHLANADDATLQTLYRNAAFCMYPSEYEGFGLPVIEAFGFGKAVIASTGGALPDVAAGLAPCLDPHDEIAWAAIIGAWITEPALRRAAETRIREGFVPRGWHEAAHALFDAACGIDNPG